MTTPLPENIQHGFITENGKIVAREWYPEDTGVGITIHCERFCDLRISYDDIPRYASSENVITPHHCEACPICGEYYDLYREREIVRLYGESVSMLHPFADRLMVERHEDDSVKGVHIRNSHVLR